MTRMGCSCRCRLNFLPHKADVDDAPDRVQRMVGAHAPVQIDLVTKQFLLRGVHAHHIGEVRHATLTSVQSRGRFGQQALKACPLLFESLSRRRIRRMSL